MSTPNELIAETIDLLRHVPAGPWVWDRCYELDELHWALSDPESKADRRVTDHRLVSINTTPNRPEWEIPFNDMPVPRFVARSRVLVEKLLAALKEQSAIVGTINRLREEEGNSVNILCPNPDFGGAAQAIEVVATWPGERDWRLRRFEGETLSECLAKAESELFT